jgi:hypothetical protein
MRFAGQLLEQMGEENTWRDLLFRPERDSAGVETLPYYPGQDTSTYQTLPYYPRDPDPLQVLRNPDARVQNPSLGDWSAAPAQGPLARDPSFNLKHPKIPGRDFDGVPNAEAMHDQLRRRLLRNPDGGQELPGFLRQASAPWGQATGWG